MLSPIGIIHSCFREKFGVPRQPGLAPDARATLKLNAPSDALRGIEGFSHFWVITLFHETAGRNPAEEPPTSLSRSGI